MSSAFYSLVSLLTGW